MGLFSKETCVICGEETRFSKKKLAGGEYICGDCIGKMYFSHNDLQGIHASVKLPYKNLTLEQVKSCLDIRKRNLEELETFNFTESLGLEFQIDENSNQVIFTDYFTCSKREKLLEKNPPVFKMKNLAFIHIAFSETETSQTVTMKATAECKVYLILGFDDPVFDIFKIEIGKIKAKEGLFSDKIKGTDKIDRITNKIVEMRNRAIEEAEEEGISIPATDMDLFWKMLSGSYYKGYVTSKDVKEYLKQYCRNDRAMIKEIKNTYDL